MTKQELVIQAVILSNQILIMNVLKTLAGGGMMLGSAKMEKQLKIANDMLKKIDAIIMIPEDKDGSNN